ncbi:MAG: hypothetical protein KAR25_00820 [Methanosarcinales archaeon]|nr:hypothetical protein [Methanosarcinales archaeon]
MGSGSASIVGGRGCELEADGMMCISAGWRFRVGPNASAVVLIVIVTRINAATRLLLRRSQIG